MNRIQDKNYSLSIISVIIMSIYAPSATAQTESSSHCQYELNCGANMWALTDELHCTFVIGNRFNRKHFLGGGFGFEAVETYYDDPPEWNNGRVPFLPIFITYVHYLPFRHYTGHSFLVGVENGIGYYPNKTLSAIDTERWALFLRCRVGADFQVCKQFGVQVSIDGLFSKFGGIGGNVGVRF